MIIFAWDMDYNDFYIENGSYEPNISNTSGQEGIFGVFVIFLFLFWFLWNIYKQEIQLHTGILSKFYTYLKTSTEKQKHCYRIFGFDSIQYFNYSLIVTKKFTFLFTQSLDQTLRATTTLSISNCVICKCWNSVPRGRAKTNGPNTPTHPDSEASRYT